MTSSNDPTARRSICRLHPGDHGQSAKTGHGQDSLGAAPSCGACELALSLLPGRHHRVGALACERRGQRSCVLRRMSSNWRVWRVSRSRSWLSKGRDWLRPSPLSFRISRHSNNQRVIAYDSDSPHLPASVLDNAFAALGACDVVVGPTYDGGYYLVGATASHPGLFNGDSMGKSNALEELLARTDHLGLSVTTLEHFYDVDVAADLLRLDAELQAFPGRAPRTAAWLAQSRDLIAQLRTGTATP